MRCFILLIFVLGLAACSSSQKRLAKWSGCPETFDEKVISKSVTMKTSEIRCGDRVMICKYSTFGFGKCKTPEKADEGSWTQSELSPESE